MLRKSTILLFFLFALSVSVWGQNRWRTGYVIKITGDTIYGQVASRFFENKKKCSFRSNKNSQAQTFNTSELGGYGFTDAEIFLPKLIGENTMIDTLFVQVLIQGQVSLYEINSNEDMQRFFLEKEGKMYELKNTKIPLEYPSEGKYYRERKEYIGILTFLLSEANIVKQINNSKPNQSSLMALVKAYHQKICGTTDCMTYVYQPFTLKTSVSLYTGLTLNSIRFGQSMYSDQRINMAFGIRFYFENVLKWAKKINFTLDLAQQSFTDYDLTPTGISPSEVIYYGTRTFNEPLSLNLRVFALKTPLMMNYFFPSKIFRPYFGVGIQNMFVLSYDRDFRYMNFIIPLGTSVPVYNCGLIGRLGSELMLSRRRRSKSLFAELNYENTFNPVSNKAFRFVNNLYGINIGYRF